MDLPVDMVGQVVVLKLQGRLDILSIKDLKNKIKSLVHERKVRIVLDMEQIDFIDSAGLGGLAAFFRVVKEAGGGIKIAALQEQVWAIFELTRLHLLFEVFDNATSAVKSF